MITLIKLVLASIVIAFPIVKFYCKGTMTIKVVWSALFGWNYYSHKVEVDLQEEGTDDIVGTADMTIYSISFYLLCLSITMNFSKLDKKSIKNNEQ